MASSNALNVRMQSQQLLRKGFLTLPPSVRNEKPLVFRAKASALIVAGLFEGEIVRRGQRQCKRGMLRSAAQDDTGEQMNLPCRREAEPHAPGSATKFGSQIFAL